MLSPECSLSHSLSPSPSDSHTSIEVADSHVFSITPKAHAMILRMVLSRSMNLSDSGGHRAI